VGFAVEETAEFVASRLEEWGIEVERGVGKTGVVGILRGQVPGPTIAIRVDMDALPIQEENTHDFVSMYPGKMHACGHDGHIAMGLGAAKLLAQARQDLAGTAVLIFQPGEEGQGGAPAMIADGVLRRHKVKAFVAGHLGVLSPELASGQVGISFRSLMAAVTTFQARVIGKGGHGAQPQDAIDPIVISAEVIGAWQRLISREIPPLEPAVLTIGQIHGGSSHNIIPNEVFLQGTIRYFRPAVGKLLLARLEEVLAGTCRSWKAGYRFETDQAYPPLVNDPSFTQFFSEVAVELAGRQNVQMLEFPLMVSEDASFFLDKVPGTYFLLGAGDPATSYPHHHPRFDLDESVLWLGAALLAGTARRFKSREK
jgi:amidohydrolase